jgi:hypothetical protein
MSLVEDQPVYTAMEQFRNSLNDLEAHKDKPDGLAVLKLKADALQLGSAIRDSIRRNWNFDSSGSGDRS